MYGKLIRYCLVAPLPTYCVRLLELFVMIAITNCSRPDAPPPKNVPAMVTPYKFIVRDGVILSVANATIVYGPLSKVSDASTRGTAPVVQTNHPRQAPPL